MKILDSKKEGNAMFAIYAFCKKVDSIADSRNRLKKEKNK